MARAHELHALGPLRGSLSLPGDKSISHRAFLLAALGSGEARVSGANPGADVASTRATLRQLGMAIREDGDDFRVSGRSGALRPATRALDCGNSGTTMRLLAGLLAAQPFTATLDGDDSLRNRPMARIARPLRQLGARVDGPDGGAKPPLIITGGVLAGGHFDLPVASAQVKSCILLAAAAAGVAVEIEEPGHSRDHTERMLEAMGAEIEYQAGRVVLRQGAALNCVDVDVPGDPSGAALVAAAACAIPGSKLSFEQVLLNPTRSAFFEVLERMGAVVEVEEPRQSAGETLAEIHLAPPTKLSSVEVAPREIPKLIDEIPALAVIAAFSEGTSVLRGLAELRVKESDRLAAIVDMLETFSVETRVDGDDLIIVGGRPVAPAAVTSAEDHRMVMATAALALGSLARSGPEGTCTLADIEPMAVSFPGFLDSLERISGSV